MFWCLCLSWAAFSASAQSAPVEFYATGTDSTEWQRLVLTCKHPDTTTHYFFGKEGRVFTEIQKGSICTLGYKGRKRSVLKVYDFSRADTNGAVAPLVVDPATGDARFLGLNVHFEAFKTVGRGLEDSNTVNVPVHIEAPRVASMSATVPLRVGTCYNAFDFNTPIIRGCRTVITYIDGERWLPMDIVPETAGDPICCFLPRLVGVPAALEKLGMEHAVQVW